VLKAARTVLRSPVYLSRALQEHRKKLKCVVGDDVVLFPASQIDNFVGRKDAISIGAHSRIHGQLLTFAHGGRISLGGFCFVGEHSRIWSAAAITIGSRVLISHNVNIHDNHSHSLSAANRHLHVKQIFSGGHPRVMEDPPIAAPIVIEDDAWLGFNSTVLTGVTVGQGAVVGAGAMVTKDVPPYSIVVGNPARVVGHARP
jgi:acetyltransferase-like isoleucine patch superfamily enzyme